MQPDATFKDRVLTALGVTERALANHLNVLPREIRELDELTPRLIAEQDEIWWRLHAYVDERLGLLLALRAELTKALQAERASRALRIAQQLERPKRSSPRS
jgi:hypothetical protein